MKGMLITVNPDGAVRTITLSAAPTLEQLKQGIGGGLIELVPGFTSIAYGGEIYKCAVFCDEEGKLKGMPVNHTATQMWDDALPTGLVRPNGELADILVGPVVAVTGDDELMEDL